MLIVSAGGALSFGLEVLVWFVDHNLCWCVGGRRLSFLIENWVLDLGEILSSCFINIPKRVGMRSRLVESCRLELIEKLDMMKSQQIRIVS